MTQTKRQMKVSQIEVGMQLVRDLNGRQTWTVEAISGARILARNDMTAGTEWFSASDFVSEFSGS